MCRDIVERGLCMEDVAVVHAYVYAGTKQTSGSIDRQRRAFDLGSCRKAIAAHCPRWMSMTLCSS